MANNVYGIDLGTSNIKIYNKNEDSIKIEKNMIAIENKKTLFAYGDSAYDMYEKAPSNIVISSPLSNGVIADIKNMQKLVKFFLMDKHGVNRPADYYISVPTDVTEVEKRAFYDLVRDANIKAKNVMVVEKAIADGIGLDVDVKNSQGVLIVNIGYDTTEISILSLGGIVLSRLIKMGGQKFDDAIRLVVRKEFNLMIGQKTAEKVKMELTDLEKENKGAIVYGRDIVTGLPVEREIPTKLVDETLSELFNNIVDSIRIILERTPPELAADIYRHGVYLTGGSSQVNKLASVIGRGTGLKVNCAENPISSVVIGLSKIIKNSHYKSVAHTIEGMSK